MKIKIDKKQLVDLIAENVCNFGDPFLHIYTDDDGYVGCASEIESELHIILSLKGLDEYVVSDELSAEDIALQLIEEGIVCEFSDEENDEGVVISYSFDYQ